jgi:hypothetical protein
MHGNRHAITGLVRRPNPLAHRAKQAAVVIASDTAADAHFGPEE